MKSSMRSLGGLGLALVLALLAVAAPVKASHARFEHLSGGEINGNGIFNANLLGAAADGSRVFLTTDERLVSGDTDGSQDIYERSGGTTKLVSAGQINGNGAFTPTFRGASTDGSRVFFDTHERLVSGDTDGSRDIYERSGGTTKLVSAGQINGNGAFSANFRGASADGSRVFFETQERLVSGDTDTSTDIYQRSGGRTRLVSSGFFQHASADGSRVFIATGEKLVSGDTDNRVDIYERSGGTTKLVSAGQINGNGSFTPTFRGASADGSRVFFETAEPLVASDTDGSQDVYERSGETTTRVSSGNGTFDANFAGASADGSRVFFASNERLVSGDADAAADVYERSGGSTRLRSAGQINGNDDLFAATFEAASADGTRVFFSTNESLVSADTDAAADVYERRGGTTKLISAGQINGNGAFTASFQGASDDGSRVFVETAEKLVAGDTDTSQDIYERSGATTTRVSSGNGTDPAFLRGVSGDGSAVFFETRERVFADDTDPTIDVYGAYTAP